MKFFCLLFTLVICVTAASADVVRKEGRALYPVKMPLYQWKDDKQSPKGIIIAIHGATLDGESYDKFGHLLAERGYMVIAADMPGFGRCYHNPASIDDGRVDYDRCEGEFARLIRILKKEYPELPIFCVGESTGSQLAARVAAKHADLIDGVIFSSMAPHLNVPPMKLVPDIAKSLVLPKRQVNLDPYIKSFISEDPRITQERLTDPEGRNHLSMVQILKFYRMSLMTRDFARDIPAGLPVLVLQGTDDRLFKGQDVNSIVAVIKSRDKKIQWLKNLGHILLETKYIKPDTENAVISWLDEHTKSGTKNVASKLIQRPKV